MMKYGFKDPEIYIKLKRETVNGNKRNENDLCDQCVDENF